MKTQKPDGYSLFLRSGCAECGANDVVSYVGCWRFSGQMKKCQNKLDEGRKADTNDA